VVGRGTWAEDPGGLDRNFEVAVNRVHRCIVGLTGLGTGIRLRVGGCRSAGLFVGYHWHRRCMLSRQMGGNDRICRARLEEEGVLSAGSATVRTWRLGVVGWRRVAIGIEWRRPCGYVRLWCVLGFTYRTREIPAQARRERGARRGCIACCMPCLLLGTTGVG
jgi:hypothetical protein